MRKAESGWEEVPDGFELWSILWQGIGSTRLEWISDRFTSFSEKIGKSLDQLGSKLVLDFCAKSMHNQYLESA